MFKILVVEDDRELNRTVCSFLNSSGYDAVGCFGGMEAFDMMYTNMFDLIVSDIMKGEITVESTLGAGSTFTMRIRREGLYGK